MNQKDILESSLKNFNGAFSHVYIEDEIINDENVKEILRGINYKSIINIRSYKDVFDRARQDIMLQKKSRKLILAKKKTDFLYKGSPLCESFNHSNFYYTSSVLNCIYNCSYCYLKGLYPSSDIVVFVNIEDFIKSAEDFKGPLYLCISYDSDLLSFEPMLHFVEKWTNFAKSHKHILIELRTKCASLEFNKSYPENFIFAYSLLPQEIINEFERGTPSLSDRLKAINKLTMHNAKIRLSIEPVIYVNNFEKIYGDFIDEIFNKVDPKKIVDINVGSFRMECEQYNRIRKAEPLSKILKFKVSREEDYFISNENEYMINYIKQKLKLHIDSSKIY